MASFADEMYKEQSRAGYIEQMTDDLGEMERIAIVHQFGKVLLHLYREVPEEKRIKELVSHFHEWTSYIDLTPLADQTVEREEELLKPLLTLLHDVAWENGVHPQLAYFNDLKQALGG